MAADPMQRDAGRDLAIAVMKGDALAVDVTHHQRHVIRRERMPQCAVAHAAPGGVAHLAVLQMKPRVGEAVEIAGVVVMQMGDDHVLDVVSLDPEGIKRIDRIERELAAARLRFLGVETGIDQDVAAAARGSARRNNRGRRPRSRADRATDNSCEACAATWSHSGWRRFRRRFPSVSLSSVRVLADGRSKPPPSAKVKPPPASTLRNGAYRARNLEPDGPPRRPIG